MKKLLLLLMTIFSISTFSQKNAELPKHECLKFMEGKVLENANCNAVSQKIKHTSAGMNKSLIVHYDSIYNWGWDGTGWTVYSKLIDFTYNDDNYLSGSVKQIYDGASWTNEEKNTSSYDINNNLTQSTYELWDGSAWFNSLVGDFTYDANNNMLTYTYTNWNGSSMINLSNGIYTYTAGNMIDTYISQVWDGTNLVWVNEYKTVNTYDEYDHILSEIMQYWDGLDWVNSTKKTYAYDASGYLIFFQDEEWDGTYWVKHYKNDYTYNANNKLTNDYYFQWSTDDLQWINSIATSYTYTAGNLLDTVHTSEWDGSYWQFSTKDAYEFNANTSMVNLTQFLYENDAWGTKMESDYTYDVNEFKESDRIFNYYNGSVSYGDSIYYYYSTQTDDSGIKEIQKEKTFATAYPNPTKGKVTIFSQKEISAVEVMNLQGKKVDFKTISGNEKTYELDLSGHETGVYFIRVKSGAQSHTLKIAVY